MGVDIVHPCQQIAEPPDGAFRNATGLCQKLMRGLSGEKLPPMFPRQFERIALVGVRAAKPVGGVRPDRQPDGIGERSSVISASIIVRPAMTVHPYP